ncbi:hypothetical protein P280DRAFT_285323 [Massarina eburnea CBS 473.64]|uniref:Uncharacterized protein n=1 Tax=Massarina eburnea CBS 473.64 TaxID=1395130 RepID=A0A6A6S3T7_9PLEO|nr:hypothetical protein P280DRAFT_285323 [Massarina eburnea CBS 473.64]
MLLPTPLPANSIQLGQLLLDPLDPTHTSISDKARHHSSGVVAVDAEKVAHISLQEPRVPFDDLRKDPAVQSFLREATEHGRNAYYITGIHTLKNPNRSHTRRDSLDIENNESDLILSIELRRVKCLISPRDEPHSYDDLDFFWTYHAIDGQHDSQLSIGLGMQDLSDMEAGRLRLF